MSSRPAGEPNLVIDRVGAPGIRLPEGQVLLDDVAVDRQEAVLEAVDAEMHRVGAAVEAAPAWIPVDNAAEIEGERTEGRPDTGGAVNLGSRPVRERDAGARDPCVELQVRRDVVARLEVGVDRRIMIGLRDAAEDVVALDARRQRRQSHGFGGGGGAGGALNLRSAASAGVASATAATTDKINFFIWCPFQN